MHKIKYCFITFGCKTNYADSTYLSGGLEAHGFSPVSSPAEADLVIVNSCVVTHRAEADARKALRRARRENPRAKVILTGCGAHLREGGFDGLADAVLPAELSSILSFLGRPENGEDREFFRKETIRRGGRARKFVKIQDGCDYRCAYCIVPHVRGRSRSRTPEDIVREVVYLEEEGVREVVITGVHVGHYGKDLKPKVTLSSLLELLLSKTRRVRFRISSIEVDEVDELLEELVVGHERVCRHLHIPLQSGDDAILRKMGRWYTTREYRERVESLKNREPLLCLGLDVITGFPGEDGESFRRTEEFLKELPVDYFHVFSFSPRKGTPAFTMEGKASPGERKERTAVLRKLGKEKRKAFLEKNRGENAAVVCEKGREKYTEGTADNYVKVKVEGIYPEGSLLDVRLTEVNGECIWGIPL